MIYKPEPADLSNIHKIVDRVESIKRLYNELPESLRFNLEDEFEKENQFPNVLFHLETISSDMANIAEEWKSKAEKNKYLWRVSNIKWDTEEDFGDEEGVSLPDVVFIPYTGDDEESIADTLSDYEGWLVKSFSLEKVPYEALRCKDCSYLIEGAGGKWICDDCGKPIEEISDDECSANQKF